MSHSTSRRKILLAGLGRAFAEQLCGERLAEADRLEATATIMAFNAALLSGRKIFWSPTIGAALASGHHWLHVHCPGCQTIGAVDLRVKPRPAETAITAVVPKLTCRSCGRAAAEPSIVQISDRHDEYL